MIAARKGRWLAAVSLALVVVVGTGLAVWMGLGGGGVPGNGNADVDPDREVAYWVAPMDSSYRRDEPGQSPMGMDLVPVYADEPGMVSVSAATRSAMGIRLGEARRESLSLTIHAPGRVEFDEGRRHRVHPRVSGWIETLAVRETGRSVQRGEPLFDLYSPELVSAQEDMLQVLRGGSDRAAAAARERLRALGVSREQIDAIARDGRVRQAITFHAPLSGVVERLNVADGTYVKPGTAIMALADRSSVWLIADVFPRHAGHVAQGQPARVRFSHRPGEERATIVEFVPPELDRDTRTVPVRMRLGNDDGDLRPGLYASVRIAVPDTAEVVTVPEQAVIRTGRQDRIALAHADGRFEIRPVTLGMAAGGRREIREGVAPGDRIVTAGQFLIDSEANLDAESERMTEASEVDARFDGRGEVIAVDRAERSVTLDHEPIEALDWPRMTMGFAVSDGIDLQDLRTGAKVEFEMRARDDGGYEITDIRQTDSDDSAGTEAGQ